MYTHQAASSTLCVEIVNLISDFFEMQIKKIMLKLEQNFDQLTTVAVTLDQWLQSLFFSDSTKIETCIRLRLNSECFY